MIAQQPTTSGELDGRRTARLRELVKTFRQSGFRTTTSRDMDAWLKAHAFFVTAVSGAIYMAGGGLSPTVRRQSDRGANGEGGVRGILYGAGAWAQRGALRVEGALYMAAPGVRHLLLAPLLRLQNGRLRFWSPCSCRFTGDARTGERLSLLIGKEPYRGSCAPPALLCNRRLWQMRQNWTHALRQIRRGYAVRSIRVSISLRSVPKSIGLVNNASAPFSKAFRFVSASP
jgi:hypothetical protein